MSRSLLLRLRPLGADDLRTVLGRALVDERGLAGAVTLADEAAEHLLRLAGGDARRALTYLEASALGLPEGGVIDEAGLEQAGRRAAGPYDRAGHQHYHVSRALSKRISGSDA